MRSNEPEKQADRIKFKGAALKNPAKGQALWKPLRKP